MGPPAAVGARPHVLLLLALLALGRVRGDGASDADGEYFWPGVAGSWDPELQ